MLPKLLCLTQTEFMPKAFDACVGGGGKVVTKKLAGRKYIHLCKKPGGSFVAGHVKTRKGARSSPRHKKSKGFRTTRRK
jgi:hypothetical protein